MDRTRSVVNRAVLALLGLALMAGGGWLASAAPSVRHRLPRWWHPPIAHTVLVGPADLARMRAHGWWTPVVVAVAAVALITALIGLAGQVRRGRARELPLSGGAVRVRTRALAQAIAGHADIPGVARARVRLSVRRNRIDAEVLMRLSPGADPGTVTRELAREVLPWARAAVAPRPIRVDVRLAMRTGHIGRVH